jgi:hypothetical protein
MEGGGALVERMRLARHHATGLPGRNATARGTPVNIVSCTLLGMWSVNVARPHDMDSALILELGQQIKFRKIYGRSLSSFPFFQAFFRRFSFIFPASFYLYFIVFRFTTIYVDYLCLLAIWKPKSDFRAHSRTTTRHHWPCVAERVPIRTPPMPPN